MALSLGRNTSTDNNLYGHIPLPPQERWGKSEIVKCHGQLGPLGRPTKPLIAYTFRFEHVRLHYLDQLIEHILCCPEMRLPSLHVLM